MKNFVARACAFFNHDFFWIQTQSTGMIAYGEPDAAPYYLPPDIEDTALGEKLRAALNASKKVSTDEFHKIINSGVLNQRQREQEDFLMQSYGYKTRRALYKNMANCSIELSDGQIKITPMHHKSIDGYSSRKDTGPFSLYVSELEPDNKFGAALREGFKRCTSSYK